MERLSLISYQYSIPHYLQNRNCFDLSKLKNEEEKVRRYKECIKKHSTDPDKMIERYYEINSHLDEHDKKITGLEKVSIRFEGEQNKLIHLNDKLSKNLIIIIVFAGFGALLSCFGFYYWYHRVQKYQDKVLKEQIRTLKNKSNNALKFVGLSTHWEPQRYLLI